MSFTQIKKLLLLNARKRKVFMCVNLQADAPKKRNIWHQILSVMTRITRTVWVFSGGNTSGGERCASGRGRGEGERWRWKRERWVGWNEGGVVTQKVKERGSGENTGGWKVGFWRERKRWRVEWDVWQEGKVMLVEGKGYEEQVLGGDAGGWGGKEQSHGKDTGWKQGKRGGGKRKGRECERVNQQSLAGHHNIMHVNKHTNTHVRTYTLGRILTATHVHVLLVTQVHTHTHMK